MDRPLVGGHVQRVDASVVGGREVALLKVRVPPSGGAARGENVHIVLAAGMDVGIVDGNGRARLRQALRDSPAPDRARWRTTIEGGRVVRVEEQGVAVLCGGRTWRASTARAGVLVLAEHDGVYPEAAETGLDALTIQGARIIERLVAAGIGGRREALSRALGKAIARLDRRVQAVRGDLGRTQGADADADRARHFVSQAASASRGATKLVATDWSSGEAKAIEMALDPSRGAREQLEAMFRRSRRLKEGEKIARARLVEAQKTRDVLAELTRSVAAHAGGAEEGATVDDLDGIEARARSAAPRDFRLQSAGIVSANTRRRTQAPHPPFRTFVGASGARILVGRGAAHNDTLTFHVAKPHDLWLHAKNHSGAHVIVTLDKGASCPADVLVEAAHLAAQFSDARGEDIVEVQYTPRRYLRKPRGSAPGHVVVDREKVIVLRRLEEVLRQLLERETV